MQKDCQKKKKKPNQSSNSLKNNFNDSPILMSNLGLFITYLHLTYLNFSFREENKVNYIAYYISYLLNDARQKFTGNLS